MEELKFSQNWNLKLNTENFTTIRIKNKKYQIGSLFNVTLRKKYLKTIEIVEIKEFKLDKLNNFMAFLDTGLNVVESQQLIANFYPKQNVFNLDFYFILCKTIIPSATQFEFIKSNFELEFLTPSNK
jgi:uncharacterized protein YqfB (UPF0267 family)